MWRPSNESFAGCRLLIWAQPMCDWGPSNGPTEKSVHVLYNMMQSVLGWGSQLESFIAPPAAERKANVKKQQPVNQVLTTECLVFLQITGLFFFTVWQQGYETFICESQSKNISGLLPFCFVGLIVLLGIQNYHSESANTHFLCACVGTTTAQAVWLCGNSLRKPKPTLRAFTSPFSVFSPKFSLLLCSLSASMSDISALECGIYCCLMTAAVACFIFPFHTTSLLWIPQIPDIVEAR